MKIKKQNRSTARVFQIVAATVASVSLFSIHSTQAAAIYYNGGDGSWNSTANFTTDPANAGSPPGAVPGINDDVTFNRSGNNAIGETITLDGDQAAKSLLFSNSGTTSLTGGGADHTLTLGLGGITINSGAGAVTIGSVTSGQKVNLLLNASQIWANNSNNTFNVVNNITNVGNVSPFTLTISGTGTTAASGVISDGGTTGTTALTKSGTGTLTLTGANTYTGNTTVSAGTLTVGNGTTGSITSSVSANTGGSVVVGNGAANAVLTVNSGALTNTVNALNVGTSTGAGAFNLVSGTVTTNVADGDGTIGVFGGTGGYGALNVSGGALNIARLYLGINSSSSIGMGTISSGTVTTSGGFPVILVRSGGATGGLTVSGSGTLNAKAGTGLFLGFQGGGGRAELNVNGGLVDTTGRSVSYGFPGSGWTGTGVLNLNGGTLLTNSIVNNGGTSLVNFAGGTLKAALNGAILLPTVSAANVNGAFGSFTGGALIDTNGSNVTASANLLAPAGNGVTSLAVTGGTGYIGAPYVSITGGGGTGATAIANIDSNGNLTGITVTNPGINYSGTPTYTLTGGGGTGATPGVITTAANTSGALTKLGVGTLTLSGANTYSGKTAIQNGALSVSSINHIAAGTLGGSNSPAASSNLGAPTTAANGTIDIGSVANAGTLLYNSGGTGETTDRIINLAGTTGGATIDQSGTGLLKFTGTNTATGAGIKTLTLQGSTAGTGEISGAIVDNTTTNTTAITKLGTNVWALTGANTYTGATTVSGGTLTVGDGTNGKITSSTSAGTGGSVTVGNTASTAVMNISSGSLTNTVNLLNVGTSTGAAAFNLTSGTFTSNGADGDGNNGVFGAGGYGALNVSGGTLNISRIYLATGSSNSIGMGSISGGIVNTTGGFPVLLSRNAGTGVLTVSGTGQLNTPNADIGVGFAGSGRGELNVTGGTINNLNHLITYGGGTSTGTGIINLNAGTVQTNGITRVSGTSLLNLNGGTFKLGTFAGTVIPTTVTTYVNGAFGSFNGGAVIDTNGINVTVATNLLAPTGNGVTALAVTGGTGYVGAPYVSISGTGTGATAIANIDSSGNLTGITVTNPGVNYTGTPTFTLTGGGGTGATPGTVTTAANTSGGLTKLNTGTLTLTGANTYTGGTTLQVGSITAGATGALGTGNVSVLTTAVTLTISTGVVNAIADSATVSLFGGGTAGVADLGFMTLGNNVNEQVFGLNLNGVAQAAGTWGSTASSAQFTNNEYFSGTGILNVVPEPSTWAMMAGGLGLLLVSQRNRRRASR